MSKPNKCRTKLFVHFFLIWVLFSFEIFLGYDNKTKKVGRIVLLGMIQIIFEQNLSPIDWKLKALRKILKIKKNNNNFINIENFKTLSRIKM